MWLGIVVTTLLVIGIIIAGLAFYATSGLVDTVDKQLTALRSDDIVLAYSYTSKDFQHATSLDDFKRFVDHFPSLKNNKSASFSRREIQNNQGILKGTLQAKDGGETPIEYRLIKEEGKWKILSIDMQPTGAGITEDQKTSDSTQNQPSASAASSSTESSTSSSSEVKLTNLFEDKNNKFSIKYPTDWIYEQPEKGTVVFSGKKGTPGYYSTVNIQTVLTKKSGGNYKNLQEFIDNLKRQAKSGSKDVNFVGEGPINISESGHGMKMNGRYLVFTYTVQGQKFNQIQFVFLRNDGQVFYAWAYTSPVSQYKVFYPIAKAMFATWSIY